MAINKSTLAEQVFDHLRELILNNTVSPRQWLKEAEIADQLGISRTPVREAMRMLEMEGLVVREANGRTVAADRSLEDMLNAFEARIALESYAARLAAQNISAEELHGLEAILRQLEQSAVEENRRRTMKLATQLHWEVCNIGGNDRINRYVREINDHIKIYRDRLYHSSIPVETGDLSHRPIVDALRAGNEDRASEAMRVHLLRSMENLQRLW